MPFKPLLTQLKPYLRWAILGGTLFFIATTLKDHWQEVVGIQFTAQAWLMVTLAFVVTLMAHVWSGWVWHWILVLFDQPLSGTWSTPVYLKTNVAKYLPGNVWHFVGRVSALQSVGTPTGIAVVSVVMEPLLMAVAALIIACLTGGQLAGIEDQLGGRFGQIAVLSLAIAAVHPRVFNPILQTLSRAKAKAQKLEIATDQKMLRAYPGRALLGEMGFVLLRSLGFIAIVQAFQPLSVTDVQALLAAFSLSWLLGLVVPGAPGGIGVFEATAISLLDAQFPVAIILSGVAVYRLVSVLAEVSAAGIVWLIDLCRSPST
ncbi:lysylphosphatidylglycerol synthase domain-containing protein [cf. Phormidesmis sp. LEGE 11477]|uniref:lysylphosphatidylglycerol synthase transmembrane domain-containing protein n=1 Tax=cf. Phormidesmis sp. LEGE 11477 TaxID=1828680 RepID=UPI00187FAE08|nr:lysylphosphatidylglycerol synthase domain-containing protein [cf. Phormidesmis sp. LEGE 11477]MBE9059620.1 flippase-like domain-containing protein [cf. Phormidesmis sp. LEGE 11477]